MTLDVARLRSSRAIRAFRTRRHSISRDTANLLRYGTNAPFWCQRIWVDPADCKRMMPGHSDAVSGRIVAGDWDLEAQPIENIPQLKYCRQRWEDDLPWEATGVFEFLEGLMENGGVIDRCRNRDELVRRHEELDRTFEQVRAEGRLRTRAEVSPSAFRERGGVYVHIGREAEPIFGRKGCHRLSIARILKLPVIPAQIGMVHAEALPVWRRKFGRRGNA